MQQAQRRWVSLSLLVAALTVSTSPPAVAILSMLLAVASPSQVEAVQVLLGHGLVSAKEHLSPVSHSTQVVAVDLSKGQMVSVLQQPSAVVTERTSQGLGTMAIHCIAPTPSK